MSLAPQVTKSEALITLREAHEKINKWKGMGFVQERSKLMQLLNGILELIDEMDSIVGCKARLDHLERLIDSLGKMLSESLSEHHLLKQSEYIAMVQFVSNILIQFQMSKAAIQSVWQHIMFLGVE